MVGEHQEISAGASVEEAAGGRRVLLVEDHPRFQTLVVRTLAKEGISTVPVSTLADARTQLKKQSFEVMILDQGLPDGSGMELLREITAEELRPQVLMYAGDGDVPSAVEAIQLGAIDYMLKPFDMGEFLVKVNRAFELAALQRGKALSEVISADDVDCYHSLPRASEKSQEILRQIDACAASASAPVLILGETGVGKERIARALHVRSPRKGMPLVAVNCAGLDTTLFESTLFGYEKGAFTGADRQRIGLVELAQGGTLFLDEIGDMPPAVQGKLLRTMETRSFRRVGGVKEIFSDFWLISATNRDLAKMAKTDAFRLDFYFRIATLTIAVPSLKERAEDIPELITQICAELLGRRRDNVTFDDGVLDAFCAYPWPGNIRELRNVIERSLILNRDYRVSVPANFGQQRPAEGEGLAAGTAEAGASARPLRDAVADAERAALHAVLRQTGGRRDIAAKILEVSRATMTRLVQKYGDISEK